MIIDLCFQQVLPRKEQVQAPADGIEAEAGAREDWDCREGSKGLETETISVPFSCLAFISIVIASVVSYSPNLMAFSTTGCNSIGGICMCCTPSSCITSVDKR